MDADKGVSSLGSAAAKLKCDLWRGVRSCGASSLPAGLPRDGRPTPSCSRLLCPYPCLCFLWPCKTLNSRYPERMPFWWLPSKTQSRDCGLEGPASSNSAFRSQVTLSVEHHGGDMCVSLPPFRKRMASVHLSAGERTCLPRGRRTWQGSPPGSYHVPFAFPVLWRPVPKSSPHPRSGAWGPLPRSSCVYAHRLPFCREYLSLLAYFLFNRYLMSVWTPGHLFYSLGMTQNFLKILLLKFYQLWSLEALSKLFLPNLVRLSIFSYMSFTGQTYCKYMFLVYGLSFFSLSHWCIWSTKVLNVNLFWFIDLFKIFF